MIVTELIRNTAPEALIFNPDEPFPIAFKRLKNGLHLVGIQETKLSTLRSVITNFAQIPPLLTKQMIEEINRSSISRFSLVVGLPSDGNDSSER